MYAPEKGERKKKIKKYNIWGHNNRDSQFYWQKKQEYTSNVFGK